MTMSGTTSDNEWQRMTASDNKWQWVTASNKKEYNDCNYFYNKNRYTTSRVAWQVLEVK